MNIKYSILFFFFLPRIFCAQDGFTNTLIEIKSLELNQARIEAAKISDIILGEKLVELIDLFEFGIDTKKDRGKQENDLTNVLTEVHLGYSKIQNGKNNYVEAFYHFSSAISISGRIENDELTKITLIAMMELLSHQIYIGTDQFEIYLKHFNDLKSDEIDEIISTFFEIKFYSKANDKLEINYPKYNKALKKIDSIFLTVSKKNQFWPYYFHEKGIQNKLNGNYNESQIFFLLVDSLTSTDLKYKNLNYTNLWQLADTNLEAGNVSKSRAYLELYGATAAKLKDSFYYDILISELYEDEKKFDSAFYHLNKSVEQEYKLGAKNFSFVTNQMSEFNRNDKLQLDNLKLDAKRKQNRNWLIAAGLALLFGAGIAMLLQKNTTKKRKLAEQEALLKQQKVETLLKEQELTSIDAMIEGQEKERQKVANELHDDLGSLMATVKLHFNNVKVDQKDPALMNAQKLLDEAYQKIRGMAHSKNSGVMANQGLLPAVKKMAETITKTNALEVTVEDFGLGERMENSLELTIFRIIQELTANIIKHSGANKANIQFTQHENMLNIIVEDNGKGFDMSEVQRATSGMGLGTIEKRIEHLEGSFTVDSIQGKGTSILIDIPV